MSGTVGVICDTTARYSMFTEALVSLRNPVNTAFDFEYGADRGRSRNTLVERSLERGSEWMLFLDDDHTFPPTLLLQLLSREQPVVASLYLQRTDPFLPIANGTKTDGLYTPIDLSQYEGHGLVPIVGAGTGGMLIRSEVFHQLEPPWFLHTTKQSEDLYFCDRCIEAGIPIFVDLDAPLGHIAANNVIPYFDEKLGWVARIIVSGRLRITVPIIMPSPDAKDEFQVYDDEGKQVEEEEEEED